MAPGKDKYGGDCPISQSVWSASGGACAPIPNSAQMDYTEGTLPGRYEVHASMGQVVGRGRMVARDGIPPDLAPGASWEHTFTTSGVYPYFDRYAPRRTGTVVVGPTVGQVTNLSYSAAITDAGFDPPAVTIAAGDTVRWTNRGAGAHAVRGGTTARIYLPLALRQ